MYKWKNRRALYKTFQKQYGGCGTKIFYEHESFLLCSKNVLQKNTVESRKTKF